MAKTSSDLITYSLERGQRVLTRRSETERKQKGQFFTPAVVARFMAQQLGTIRAGDRLLDPAIGSGVLACAVIERAIIEGQPLEFWIDGYEIDPELAQTTREVLEWAVKLAATQGIIVHTRICEENFILNNRPASQPYLLLADSSHQPEAYAQYTHIIANPPYFKLNSSDPHVKAAAGQIKGHTNIYSLFLALAAKKLLPGGQACFILPRSFCSGTYFSALRQELIAETLPIAVHVFESRQDTFGDDAILQENVIFAFRRRKVRSTQIPSAASVCISASRDTARLQKDRVLQRQVSLQQFLDSRYSNSLFFRLPIGELDEQIIEMVHQWSGSLNQYGLGVSTGPVVAFRARAWLMDIEAAAYNQAVPLLWMQNVKQHQVEWPVTKGHKPQAISLVKEARSLLVPVTNYILLRRFSAKEEPRRLIAAPFLAKHYNYPWIGLENHLNYIYKERGDLTKEETLGLSALLNSALMDRYFRIVNGNTQVNATELRALPLPPLELIREIGKEISETRTVLDPEIIVFNTLRLSGHLLPDFPLIKETRITMGKIQEAQEVLKILGLPPAQQNEMSALTLLVLAELSEETPWSEAKQANLRIHDMLIAIKERYAREYAENTRETIRRQVIHQFIQAGLVIQNPDNPSLPTNSPRTHYALSEAALHTIRFYQLEEWLQAVQSFLGSQKTLLEIYQRNRVQQRISLRLATGEEYHLSPGRHNQLQAAVIEEFGPRFAPGAKILYLGDAENKMLILDATGFEELGIPIPSHDKLPDIVLYDQDRNWLFLIEAVISHGPVSPKRYFELEEILKRCSAGRIYVSAFPDFATFRNFLMGIAWETEVWLAETPDHLIHFNGEHLLKPHIS